MGAEQAAEAAWIEAIEVMRHGDDLGAALCWDAGGELAREAILLFRLGEWLGRTSLWGPHQHRERAAVIERDADAGRGREIVARRLDLLVKRDGGALLEPMNGGVGP